MTMQWHPLRQPSASLQCSPWSLSAATLQSTSRLCCECFYVNLRDAVTHCDILSCVRHQCDSSHCTWCLRISPLDSFELDCSLLSRRCTMPPNHVSSHVLHLLSYTTHFLSYTTHFSLTHTNAHSHSQLDYSTSLRKQKGEKITIWERNFQLAFWSILLLLTIVGYERFQTDLEADFSNQLFFRGWTINTVMIALIQAVSISPNPPSILPYFAQSCHVLSHTTEYNTVFSQRDTRADSLTYMPITVIEILFYTNNALSEHT